jgi:hypothetical protein
MNIWSTNILCKYVAHVNVLTYFRIANTYAYISKASLLKNHKYCKDIKIEDLDGIHLCEFDTFIGPQKPQTDHILDKFQ